MHPLRIFSLMIGFPQFYIAVLLVVLICSLGNRPQGSKWTYTLAIIAFGICNIIALWCAGYTVYLALPHTKAGWSNVGKLFANHTFRDIAISLAATYGLYFFGSIIHMEIWHLFTSSAQFSFLLPSCECVMCVSVGELLIHSFVFADVNILSKCFFPGSMRLAYYVNHA